MASNGDLLPRRRRRHHGPQLLGIAAHGVLLVLLEHPVELKGAGNPLPSEPHNQPALLRPLEMVRIQQMGQQHLVVLLADPVKIRQGQHLSRQAGRRHFPVGLEYAHGLMVQQTVGQPVQPGRFHPLFFQIQLHQRNGLEQLPGNGGWQHGPDFRLVLPDYKPHLRRQVPPSRPAHPLQKRRHRPGRINLERPLQPPNIDAQLQGGGGHRSEILVVFLH